MNISEFVYTVLLRPAPLKQFVNGLLKRLVRECVELHGARVYLNPDDPVISGALTLGLYEKDEIAFFRKYFRDDMNLVDVGANVGLYSALALSTPGFHGHLLCLEPHDASRRYLEKTLAANSSGNMPDRITLSKCAASDEAAEALLYTNPDNFGDNRLYADTPLANTSSVMTDTLDHLSSAAGLDQVQFVKIDVQGFECRALRGARELLEASEHCILLSEFWPAGLANAGDSAETYLDLLESLGFSLYRLAGKDRLEPLDRVLDLEKLSGRRYLNIAGFKGNYHP